MSTAFFVCPAKLANLSVHIAYLPIHESKSRLLNFSCESELLVLPYFEVSDFKGFDFFGTVLSYRLIEAGKGRYWEINKWWLRVGWP